jgi:hypothetical protein
MTTRFLPKLAAALGVLWTLGAAASFGQAPPAVPALPDAERRTSYSITASTCACSLGFQYYQDSNDVDSAVQVYINGVRKLSTDSTAGWAITSATGSLGTIPRPVTDGVLTFNSAQTGTVQIVGSQRPRRLTEVAENRGVAARDFNQFANGVEAQLREAWDLRNRTLLGPPGQTYGPLPAASLCPNAILAFDATGLLPQCQTAVSLGVLLTPATTVVNELATWGDTVGHTLNDATGISAVPGGPLTISPTANSANQGLLINQSGLLGNVAGTNYAWAVQASPALLYNSIAVTTDTANVTGTPTQFTVALNVGLVTGGANSQGTKTAFSAEINHAYSGSNPTLGRDHIAASFYAIGSVGDGGTGTTAGTAKGTLFATNPVANASSGATNLFSVSGGEVDVGIATGASARHRLGWSVVAGGNLRGDTGSGGLDAALEVAAGATGWATGLIFSSLHGAAPIATTGTLIGTDGVNITAASGVDFSAYTLTTFLRGPSSNFIVSGAGAITGTSLQINNGTISWNDGTAVGIANIGALFTRSVQLGSNNNFNVVFVTNNTLAGYFDASAVGTFNLGSVGISQGVLNINGLTSGTVAIKAQAAAGTYNFNLPISAGGANQVLTSQGGGATAQSYQDINALLAVTSPITKSGTTTVTFACATCVTSAASLTANQLVIGSGSQGEQSLGTLGTTTTVLHGNAAGAPTFAAIVSADLNITTTTCTNQFLTAISATAVGTCTTDTLASAQHANQGTTTTLLHGNAAGNPSWTAVVSADLNITTTTCTNQFITAISATAAGTCTTATLASAQFANQGTTTTVLHGNAAGNPSFAAVSLTADVSGILPGANGGTGVANTGLTITLAGSLSLPAVVQGDIWYGSAAGTISALAKNTTATRYLANTGTSNNPAWAQVDLTNGVTGALPGANGGTGLSTAAIGDIIYASATTPTWSRLADVATGSVLVSGGVNTAPAWSASPTITTSVTTPLHIGGTGTTGTQLTLQTTTGVGTTDAISVKGGNNGGTTFGTWNTNGLGIGGTIVNQLAIGSSHALTVQSTSARSTMELINSSTGTGGVAGSFAYYNGTERLVSMDASADGATNSGIWTVYVDNAGALTGQMSLNHVGFLSVNGSLGVGVGSDPGVGAVFAGAFVQATTYLQSGTKLRAVGTAPGLTSCGTTPTIEGSDLSGTVTMGTGSPTGCVITFNAAYISAPRCTVSWRVNLASMQYAVTNGAITLTQTATSSNKVDYICSVQSGGWLLKRDLDPAANDNTPAFMDQAA